MANSVATGRVPGYKLWGTTRQFRRPLLVSSAPYKGWFLGSPSGSGSTYATSMPAGTGYVSLGVADRDQSAGSASGNAIALLNSGIVSGYPVSQIANDALTDADFCAVAWAANNQTPGKLSNSGGVSRSMLGICYGLDNDPGSSTSGTPIIQVGPEAWLMARGAHMADAHGGGTYTKAIDAAAATDLAEDLMPRAKVHGTVTAIEFVVSGTTLAASGLTNFKTITISKRDGAGGGAVVVGTLNTTVLAMTQWTAVPFTLSVVAGAVDLLETDILTFQQSHGGTGAVMPAGAIRVVQKVQ